MNKLMKKSLFMLTLLMLSALTNALAQDQVATLQHNGEISVFYGGNAFVDAYNAADASDVITLSSGNFNVCNIDKLITIHGAGARQDPMVIDRTPTVFLQRPTINCGGSETNHLIIEGVCFSEGFNYHYMYYAEFYRCSFNGSISIYSYRPHSYLVYEGNMSNSKFINCRISDITFRDSANVFMFNSIVFYTSYLSQTYPTDKNVIAYNSYIVYGEDLQCSDFYNCIISRSSGVPQETCTLYNSVMAKNGYEGSLLENAYNRNCMEVDTISQVFENYTGDFNDEQFILSDEISSSIQGNDGTEVGIYGGMYPYTDRPVYMIMRHCTVGNRTTGDGHLSVDIEVVTEQ